MDLIKKEDITREMLHASLLKQIIIRIDYTSINDFSSLISELRNNSILANYYPYCKQLKVNNAQVVTPKELRHDDNQKYESSEPLIVYHFCGPKMEFDQESVFDISERFMFIDITCDENYNSIDKYIEFISIIIEQVRKHDAFSKIVRIGLRKIDSTDYLTRKDAENDLRGFDFESLFSDEKIVIQSEISSTQIIPRKQGVNNFEFFVNKSLGFSHKGRNTEEATYTIDHDGYLLSEDELREKAKRNNELLFKELEKKEDPYIYFQIAQSYGLMNDNDNQYIYYQKAYDLSPNINDIYTADLILSLGYSYINKQEFSKALHLYNKHYKELKHIADFLCLGAYASIKAGLPIEAINICKDALSSDEKLLKYSCVL